VRKKENLTVANIAILIGNSKYTSQKDLACCANDVTAMAALLQATEKFDKIRKLTNVTSDQIRASVRDELEGAGSVDEFYFYFSGHGIQIRAEFFYNGTEFDTVRPNETGLSNSELHALLRAYNPKLVVKVIDACNSGTTLIKADAPFITDGKGVLNDVIQIASCQNSQFSITGNPLSLFTKHFCHAAFRKESGPVYYTDLINTLRDDFLNDDDQTPHFVSQGTGREKFAADAVNLAKYRAEFAAKWEPAPAGSVAVVTANTTSQGMLPLIQEAENHFVAPADAEDYISRLFDGIIDRLNTDDFSEFYNIDVVEHDNYKEQTARAFIIRSLSGENRPDNFVTASISRDRRIPDYTSTISALAMGMGNELVEKLHLRLNCSINRAQIKITLNPRFRSLNQIRLVVSCAPSLNQCYIFEISTRHVRSDWETFDESGSEIAKNWYGRAWNEDNDWLIDEICDRVHTAIRKHVEATAQRLATAKADEISED
jgi:Caspase domain